MKNMRPASELWTSKLERIDYLNGGNETHWLQLILKKAKSMNRLWNYMISISWRWMVSHHWWHITLPCWQCCRGHPSLWALPLLWRYTPGVKVISDWSTQLQTSIENRNNSHIQNLQDFFLIPSLCFIRCLPVGHQESKPQWRSWNLLEASWTSTFNFKRGQTDLYCLAYMCIHIFGLHTPILFGF